MVSVIQNSKDPQDYTQIPYNNDFYLNLISTLESKFIPNAQIQAFTSYMESNCDPNFTHDIMLFIKDFNFLLSQAIHAIKNLLSQNSQLVQNQTLASLDKEKKISDLNPKVSDNQNNNEIIYLDENNTFELKTPLRQLLKKKPINTKYIQPNNDKSEKPLQLSSLVNEEEQKDKNKLAIIKLSNEILKSIEFTKDKKELFCRKYVLSRTQNITEKYKTFLQNIIEYKYSLIELNDIYNDIAIIQGKGKDIQKKGNKQRTISMQYEENKPFTSNLRHYPSNTQNNETRFVPFTSPYSRLFSQN